MPCEPTKCTVVITEVKDPKLDHPGLKITKLSDNSDWSGNFKAQGEAKKAVENAVRAANKEERAPETPACPEGCECVEVETKFGEWKDTKVKVKFKIDDDDYSAETTAKRRVGERTGRCVPKEIGMVFGHVPELNLTIAIERETPITGDQLSRVRNIFT